MALKYTQWIIFAVGFKMILNLNFSKFGNFASKYNNQNNKSAQMEFQVFVELGLILSRARTEMWPEIDLNPSSDGELTTFGGNFWLLLPHEK